MSNEAEAQKVAGIEVAGVQLNIDLQRMQDLLAGYIIRRTLVDLAVLPAMAGEIIQQADAVAAELQRLTEGLAVMEKAAVAAGMMPPAFPQSEPNVCQCMACTKRREEARRRAN